ncbi:MAG: D-alanyl-D-alanine carboxypeptidase/D-alanyl-D-alanine-endopeptidase [Prevotella sp.]|nr:D-alanyl-D-alanine carboxypeptidase/D-alanyl-D-alanine-endopeptidase [Prevotella sp.]
MRRLLFFLFSVITSLTGFAQEEQSIGEATDSIVQLPWPQNVQVQLDSIVAVDELLQTSQLGLMIYDLTADSAIYTFNHRQSMRPASTMKVVTAVTALNRLGGNYQLSTSLYYTGEVKNATLTGSLYCVGGMDPMFSQSDVRDFVERVRQMGVDTLRGSIVTDNSMKDTLRWGEGWCWDDDNPPLYALQVGRSPYFADIFIDELIRAGITIDSLTLFEDRPPMDAIPLTSCRHSIDQLLLRMMKESDNYYAECLYYQLAASFGLRPAHASHARTLEKQLVTHLGLNIDQFRFADGSGLSLYNYVSAELLTMLLRYAWHTPDIYAHLLPSLPVAGQDGTLKKRMKKTPAEGNVKAKTGTLTGVISLAGYLTAPNGHELCFTIINQSMMSARAARTFQDKICVLLCSGAGE